MHRALNIFREPLVLFSLTAAAVFGIHALTGGEEGKTIEVRPEAIAGSIALQRELIGRPLTEDERTDLVDSLVRQEILVQEASARGLHLHDSKTRERLVTQMYFVMTEDAPDPRPEDLAALLEEHPENYMFPESVSFDHMFFETDKAAALAVLDQITAGEDVPLDAGDRFWLGNRLEYYAPAQIEIVLGAAFGSVLKDLEPGEWAGPIRSGRGWHLVRLDVFHPPQNLPEDELDRKLRSDWAEGYRAKSFATRLKDMRETYTIALPSEAEIAATQPRLQTAQAAPVDEHSQ